MALKRNLEAMKKSWLIFWHLFFWLVSISFFMYVAYVDTALPSRTILIIFLGYGLINISLFYLNFLWFIPRFLDRSQYRRYALFVVLAIAVYALGKYLISLYIKPYIPPSIKTEETPALEYLLGAVITNLLFIFLSTGLKFAVDWFRNERVQRDLENQRLIAELAFLKSQINPHFLFNSLNSVYSLAYQRSEDTPGAILKLAEIMRYMLYECNDSQVALAKEVQYMQSYIDMQKIRYAGKVYIDFSVNGDTEHQQIAPLLLIAFLENAFKHGVVNDPSQPVVFKLTAKEDGLCFYTYNKKHQHNRDAVGGIGLHNVKRRLDLLYPGHYRMKVKDEADSYSCELSLNPLTP